MDIEKLKDKKKEELRSILRGAYSVSMLDKFVDELIDEINACGKKMYGWENAKTGRISMVYDSMKLLEMCSPDHFETRTKNGEGEIVELTVIVSKQSTIKE